MPEKTGFVASAALAALAWLLTHYVDRIIGTPTVEYWMSDHSCAPLTPGGPDACDYTYSVQNLSRTATFGPVQFRFLARPGGRMVGHALRPVEPANEGDEFQAVQPGSAEFIVPRLMPNATIIIGLKAIGGRPVMAIASPNDSIRLTHPNVETFLVRHELAIVAVLILLWLAVLAGLLISRVRAPARRASTIEKEGTL